VPFRNGRLLGFIHQALLSRAGTGSRPTGSTRVGIADNAGMVELVLLSGTLVGAGLSATA
ncbi:MAG: hypothetical protein ACXVII_34820, partial [Solirubrobacteraceae bacterium]